MAAYGWEITLSLLSGLTTGALTSYVVTQYFKKKEQLESIIQSAKDLTHECHVLLDLTNQLIDQLALRKYHAYWIASVLEDMDGETKRRTRNEEVIRAKLSEISKETLDTLCVEIHYKKLGGNLRAVAARRVHDILNATDACVDAAA
jgi:succinate dehydrogenase/fumarate reductase flavoprotein subunit